jgi:hypothetical protein
LGAGKIDGTEEFYSAKNFISNPAAAAPETEGVFNFSYAKC